MTLTRLDGLQAGLTLVIILLILIILYPAWTVASARFTVKSDQGSGATLAERYLILGDWPSGNENNLLSHFDDFQVYSDSAKPLSQGEGQSSGPNAGEQPGEQPPK
jgi:uncharacterized SAM-binding protein YcdF (DUF218 family)